MWRTCTPPPLSGPRSAPRRTGTCLTVGRRRRCSGALIVRPHSCGTHKPSIPALSRMIGCVHPDGPWAATPDGIGNGTVCEVKTGSVSGLASARRRHEAQMQWQMWVTGASGCLYVTEERLTDEMGFTPGERTHEWVDRDDDLILELVDVAERFLSGDDVTELDVLIATVVDIKAERDKV